MNIPLALGSWLCLWAIVCRGRMRLGVPKSLRSNGPETSTSANKQKQTNFFFGWVFLSGHTDKKWAERISKRVGTKDQTPPTQSRLRIWKSESKILRIHTWHPLSINLSICQLHLLSWMPLSTPFLVLSFFPSNKT